MRTAFCPPPSGLSKTSQVFVLTNRKESEQKAALKLVRELALSRCGVRVETTPWLVDRPALDEFVDNHRRVLRHIVRHRLAIDTWWVVAPIPTVHPWRGSHRILSSTFALSTRRMSRVRRVPRPLISSLFEPPMEYNPGRAANTTPLSRRFFIAESFLSFFSPKYTHGWGVAS